MDRTDLLTGRNQPGGREPAPGALRLVQDLVNTVDRENRVELLADPEGLRDWLALRGLPGGEDVPSQADVRSALRAREALRSLLHANNGGPGDGAARATLERIAERGRLRIALSGDGPSLEPAGGGVDAALALVVGRAFTAMLDGSWARLKACPREVCGWAFYDRSTNNRATWCSMLVCGNRVKAGAYYRRRVRPAAP